MRILTSKLLCTLDIVSELVNNQTVTAQDISRKYDLPHHFISSLMSKLTTAQIAQSKKGPGGGCSLSSNIRENLDQYTLADIVNTINEFNEFHSAKMNLEGRSLTTVKTSNYLLDQIHGILGKPLSELIIKQEQGN